MPLDPKAVEMLAARAAVFIALTLSNLVLIHVNRRPAGRGRSRQDGRNPYAGWIATAAVLLLLVVLGTPALRRLFAFAVPDAASLLLSCLVAVATLAWCALLGYLQASRRPGAR